MSSGVYQGSVGGEALDLIALLIGSSVASRVAEPSYRHEGVLHGPLTWGVVMLCTMCLPATVLGVS